MGAQVKRFIFITAIMSMAAAVPMLPQAQSGPRSQAPSSQPLATVIQEGRRAEALAMIKAGADVNQAQPDGTRPIHWAVYRVDHELVDALISKKHELKTVADRRREFLAGVRKDDQVWVPRFQQHCRVRKINRSDERLTVQLGALTVEIPFDDVSFVSPPGAVP